MRDFATHLGKLALHFWRPDFTPEQAKQMYGDFVADLAGITAEELAEACRAWRLNPANSFFPTPGKLRELLKDNIAERSLMAAGGEVLLQALNRPPTMDDALDRGSDVGERLKVLNEAMKVEGAKRVNQKEINPVPRPKAGRSHTDASELLAALSKKTGMSPEQLRRDNPIPPENA